MAFNLQTFKTRTLTAIIFVVVMLVGLLFNQWSFLILFSVIHFGCWIEYQKLVGLIDKDYQQVSSVHRNIIMLIGWCFILFMSNHVLKLGNIALKGIGWYGIMVLTIIFCLVEILLKKNLNIKTIAYSAFGLVYISLSWGLLIGLRFLYPGFLVDYGLLYVLFLIASIWINDTMQYIVGSLIGKTPFSKVSPKKTWEGTIGGSILCVAVIALTAYFGFKCKGVIAIGIPLIAAVMGTLGDLFESKLKRMANVKDSGQFMPGHGGFLDRFDSLLLASPFVWLLIKLFA